VADHTIDDLSSFVGDTAAVPGIVVVATGLESRDVVLEVPAELGRRITAGKQALEIDDERMSKEHASVRWDRGGWLITDRDSRNGTWVDGERISGEARRRGDTVLRLGHTLFMLLTDVQGHPARSGAQVIGPELDKAFEQIRRNATSDALLIHGESGTGKELAARLYHDAGPRKAGPFVAVNCAAIPEGVAERLLFGSKKGAFSGAIESLGNFQMAAGGTLFLDEIADLDPLVQAKLLRVLETHEVIQVGATSGTTIDVGIVAASHRELRLEVAERRFRDDLYYRLARVTVTLPPLRERKVDLVRFVQREVAAVEPKLGAHSRFVEACCLRPWPGNVRELVAAVQLAASTAVAAGRDVVRVEDLPALAGQPVGSAAQTSVERKPAAIDTSKEAIAAALATANGVISVAARALGLHRTQLYRLMQKYGLGGSDDS
jgi:transcriptional regulator with PAS, ATPase and Fis domain